MFTDDPSEEDALIMQLLLLFLFANPQHFLRMRLLYLMYYRTVYIPMVQMLLATPIPAQTFQSFLPRKKRRKNRRRSGHLFRLLLSQDEEYFQDHFRLSKACFQAICSYIQALGFYLPSQRYTSKRRMVTVAHALGMLLIFIGHGCNYRITGALCGFAKQTTRVHVNRMKQIVLDSVVPTCICWPSPEEVDKIKADFFARGFIRDVVGAVDGTHIPILIPEDEHIDYINRKGIHSLVFQGIAVGTSLKFVDFFGGWAGSVHDAHVFQNSSIAHKFKQGLYQGMILLADAAYAMETWCLTPFERKTPQDLTEANYNFWHSSARMVVERAFGVLKKRFPILKKPWTANVEEVVAITTICVALHNLCCDSDSEWDADHYTMILERAPVGAIPDIAFDMEYQLNQRAAGRAAKEARQNVAAQCPTQPARARRGIVADIVSL